MESNVSNRVCLLMLPIMIELECVECVEYEMCANKFSKIYF